MIEFYILWLPDGVNLCTIVWQWRWDFVILCGCAHIISRHCSGFIKFAGNFSILKLKFVNHSIPFVMLSRCICVDEISLFFQSIRSKKNKFMFMMHGGRRPHKI